MHTKLAVLLPILLAFSSIVTDVAAAPVADEAAFYLAPRATTLALSRRPAPSSSSVKPASSTKTTSILSSTTSVKSTTSSSSKATTSSIATSTTIRSISTTTTKASSTTSKSTSAAAPSSTTPVAGSGDAIPDAWSSGILSAHNAARSTHGAANLVWSTELTSAAKSWAQTCVWHHGGTSNITGGAGQNLAAAGSSASTVSQSGQAVVDAWMSEESSYDPANPTYSHFTQVVWKNTQELGCFQASCAGSQFVNPDGTTVFPASIKSAVYTVCDYRKPGNYAGEYQANVEKVD